MSEKPKLPAGWDVYTGKKATKKKPVKPRAKPVWKYVPWVVLIGLLAAAAFYPWQF